MIGGSSKVRTKRVEPPARKLANTLLAIEGVRGLSGKEGPGDILERQRMRSQALQDVDLQNREAMRGLGERGIESPGMYERLSGMREGALGNLIAARNEAIAKKRAGAVGIMQNLLAENQPYQKTRVHESKMSKAAPYIKMGAQGVGAVVGGIYGGPAGAQMGAQAGGAGADMITGGDAAQVPQQGASSTATPGSGGAGVQSPQMQYGLENTGGQTSTLNEATGGQIGQSPQSPVTQTVKKPKTLTGNQSGLARLQSLFGGM